MWKRGLIDVLKDSPSKNRKFLRWSVASRRDYLMRIAVLENGELEVFPETSL